MSSTPCDYDVVIAGLGPTGLTLAHALGMRGHQVLVLEREPQFYGNARAVFTDAECMRIFQSLGMADRLAADMLQDAPVQMMLPNGSVLFQLKNTRREHDWSWSNFFYQPFLETALAEGLDRYPNVTVRRGREVTRLAQDADGVAVFHAPSDGTHYGGTTAPARATPGGDEACVRARWLVGADGGRSTIRTQLGIGMTGQNFPNPWLVVDIQVKDPNDGLRHLPYFNFICDPDCPTVCCVQPNGHHRFEFMLMPGQTREQMTAPDNVQRYLSKYIDVSKFEILRTLVYTFNALMAEKWRDGRVLLAGDAAHMTPQFIGQGMNAGVRDAFNLAWKLDAVLRGQAGPGFLDSYAAERAPHASAMIREAIRMKSFVSMTHPVGTALRNVLTRLVVRLPKIGPFVRQGDFIPKPIYRAGSYFGLPRRGWRGAEGRLMPQPILRGPDGRRQRLDDLLGPGFALIGAGVDPRSTLDEPSRRLWQTLGARYITVYPLGGRPNGAGVERAVPPELVECEDLGGDFFRWWQTAGGRHGAVAIVRPDKFVFALRPGQELSVATREFARQMHRDTALDERVSAPIAMDGERWREAA
ncbi:bifunctional 3-(3-hydroxy-phenyl)propionate/3-hydroxycinnamic acid hydroxylase [Ideonella sp. B7]|uniref:bifunctional 3-(3-hydroxy-phenyl)propionate/3-hydroxycinnamic acid hydroxylase MhpA n=1 Tax=Ideonella benzenivorans TaxID=2831643 RepID=UPI001CEC4035|nr:bifunctional 3-(3-hydroxy-phenyl)propionate/3-hydroxycinnamic acid hydroxylase [Ideonella benzenivorans]MCA6215985.1 bifunctional 3-(3-hydroxy-phenyl)propionate/3-hydroxycinnamic acid hydroxylase [Ideonella benzenivorans]